MTLTKQNVDAVCLWLEYWLTLLLSSFLGSFRKPGVFLPLPSSSSSSSSSASSSLSFKSDSRQPTPHVRVTPSRFAQTPLFPSSRVGDRHAPSSANSDSFAAPPTPGRGQQAHSSQPLSRRTQWRGSQSGRLGLFSVNRLVWGISVALCLSSSSMCNRPMKMEKIAIIHKLVCMRACTHTHTFSLKHMHTLTHTYMSTYIDICILSHSEDWNLTSTIALMENISMLAHK